MVNKKRARLVVVSAVMLVVVLLLVGLSVTGCVEKLTTAESSEFGWSIIQSPITGRYYEVMSMYAGSRAGVVAMSEVTQAEYETYILSKARGQ